MALSSYALTNALLSRGSGLAGFWSVRPVPQAHALRRARPCGKFPIQSTQVWKPIRLQVSSSGGQVSNSQGKFRSQVSNPPRPPTEDLTFNNNLNMDQGMLSFNLEHDLSSEFNWNMNQLFVYMVASYNNTSNKRNEAHPAAPITDGMPMGESGRRGGDSCQSSGRITY